MRPRRWLVACVTGALTLTVASCGDDNGGEQLTAEEFFVALDVLGDEYDATTDDLEAGLEQSMATATTEEARVATFVGFTEDGSAALEAFVVGVDELNAPDDLTEFQDRAVSAGRAAIDSLNDITAALSDVSTDDELQADAQRGDPVLAVLWESDTQEAFDRFNDICFEAQTLADDAGVDVDYDCEEE